MKYNFDRYIKLIILKVSPFETEIVDESNFGLEDEYEMIQFQRKYLRCDDCVIVKVDM